MVGIVSLKASIEAWDQVDALLRRALQAYARTLCDIEKQISQRAAEKFAVEALDFSQQQATLAVRPGAPIAGLPALESVSREVEAKLRSFGERLCQNACSLQDLRDVSAVLEKAIAGILETGHKHHRALRTAAESLNTASQSDNVMALRILVRRQSAELAHLADEAARESENLATALKSQVRELAAGLKVAHDEARRDPLTGLLNRRALKERIDELQAQSTPRCLVLLDLDRFKSINDQFGYLAGDELLRQVAARIQSLLLPSYAAARWGGDEFIVLVDGSLATGMALAQKLDERLRDRYKLGVTEPRGVFAQASVGVSEWKSGEDVNSVIERADLALKSRKRRGDGAGVLETGR